MTNLLMDARTERNARVRANDSFYKLGRSYHEGLNLHVIDSILQSNGFTGLEPAIYCGRDGQTNEQVGARTWISMSWHRMESGRYEVVVYLHQ
jgi:hypothetical protein